MKPAPFYAEITETPPGAEAVWDLAEDGVKLRLALLAPPPDPCCGTVLLLPGRTEFVEKYGPAAIAFQNRGYACVSIDWRGQGLSDRALEDRATGHVDRFHDYQHDVDRLLRLAHAHGLPEPFFLLAHSMGGAIGLRSLHDGLPVAAAAFSAPMWGITLPAAARPAAEIVSGTFHAFGFGDRFVPTTSPVTYVLDAPFADNTLTTDPEMFAWMKRQIEAHPDMALGGPSITWFHQALRETRRLRNLPPPPLPCIAWMGSNERIVEQPAIRRLMARWPNGTLTVVPGAEHELMMETPAIRDAFFDACAVHFAGSAAV